MVRKKWNQEVLFIFKRYLVLVFEDNIFCGEWLLVEFEVNFLKGGLLRNVIVLSFKFLLFYIVDRKEII